MGLWGDKIPSLKKAVEAERVRRQPVLDVCIHGETNCVRCAAEDFNTPGKVTNWEAIEQADVKRAVMKLPKLVVEMMKRHPGKVVVAGGFIRAIVGNERINDVDVFIPGKSEASSWTADVGMVTKSLGDTWLQSDDNGREIQIIWRYPFKEPYEILEQFDYTVAKGAIWFDEGNKKSDPTFKSICHERFYRDITRKALVYDCDRDTERVQSIPRLLKYAYYGYNIDPDNLAEVIVRTCLSLKLDDGFEGMIKDFKGTFQPECGDKEWSELTKKYQAPPPPPARSHSYSYGGS